MSSSERGRHNQHNVATKNKVEDKDERNHDDDDDTSSFRRSKRKRKESSSKRKRSKSHNKQNGSYSRHRRRRKNDDDDSDDESHAYNDDDCSVSSSYSSSSSSSSDRRHRKKRHKKHKRKKKQKKRRKGEKKSRAGEAESTRSSSYHRARGKDRKFNDNTGSLTAEKKEYDVQSTAIPNAPSDGATSVVTAATVPREAAAAARASSSKRIMAPMSRQEYEALQSQVRKVYDPESGRYRMIRGTGEIIECIVSRSEHEAINRQATLGDGSSYARHIFHAATKK